MNDAEMHAVLDAVEIVDVVEEPVRLARREEWVSKAACRGMDPELFFPGRGESTVEARQVCATCTVACPCLEYALRSAEKYGIWGNTSERERRTMRRDIRKAVRPINHGTPRGYNMHRERGEMPPCPACREAHTRYVMAARHARRGEAA